MRRWMAFAGGAAVLCAAGWYFGRPTVQPNAPAPVVAQAAPTEAPKEPPPKMIEVIDLARAYEPVREPEPVQPGGVDPASFIEEPTAPRRIPPAFDEDNPYADVIRTVQEWDGSIRERMELMPRVVPQPSQPTSDPGFWGIGSGPVQNLLHFFEDPLPVRLDVMPRDVSQLREAFHRRMLEQEKNLRGWEIRNELAGFRLDEPEGLKWMPQEVHPLTARIRALYGFTGNGSVPLRVSCLEIPPGSVGLNVIPREVIALWLQVAELYGYVGVESER